MELRHLRYFIALAEELHFRRASERLHIVQPALSEQIRRLEEELQVTLLVRTKRHAQLTEAGRAFLEGARRIIVDVERVVRVTRLTSQGGAGELVVGCTQAGEVGVLPRVLPAFQKRFPRVSLAVESLSSAAQVQALREGRIHVGFILLPWDDHALLTIEQVFKEPLVVVLPESHPLAKRQRVPLRALANQPYISFPRRVAPGFYDSIMSFCHQAGFALNVVKEADHFQTQQSLVALRLGLSLQPESIRNVSMKGVVYRKLRPPVPYAEIGMVYRQDNSSEVLRAFALVVKEVFREVAG